MARKQQKSAKGGAPISSHPAFPAIVAIWFAALFGIGSMVLPSSLYENAVVATGLDAVVPAAAPPLGFTARAAIAIAVSLFGLAAGVFLARKVVAAQSDREGRTRDLRLKEEDRHPDAPAKRPISARRELGSEGLGPVDDPWKFEDEWAEDEDDADEEFDSGEDRTDRVVATQEEDAPKVNARIAGRRRSLSVTDDSGPSEFLQHAPLPGRAPDDMLELDILEVEPLEQVSAEPEPAHIQEFASEAAPAFAPNVVADADNDAAPAAAAEPNAMNAPAAPLSFAPASTPEREAFPAMPAPDQADAGQVQNFHAPQAPRQDFAAPSAPDLATTEQEQPMTPTDPISAAPTASAAQAGSASPALSDLGMAELVERFAQALQAKASREQKATEDAAVAMAPSLPQATPPAMPAMPVADGANPFADRAGEAEFEAASKGALPFTSPLSDYDAIPAEPAVAEASGADVAAVPVAPAATQMPAAEEPAPQPMVFCPAGSAEPPQTETETKTPASGFGQSREMPSALQPVGFDDDDDIDEDTQSSLAIDFSSHRSFAQPTPASEGQAGPAPFSQPVDFADHAASDEEDAEYSAEDSEAEGSYSSLLSMKSKLAGQDFARVDDEQHGSEAAPEPVVVFPGQGEAARAEASGGLPPQNGTARPFDAPQASISAGREPQHLVGQSSSADPSETERALREALEKLQRMSGAA